MKSNIRRKHKSVLYLHFFLHSKNIFTILHYCVIAISIYKLTINLNTDIFYSAVGKIESYCYKYRTVAIFWIYYKYSRKIKNKYQIERKWKKVMEDSQIGGGGGGGSERGVRDLAALRSKTFAIPSYPF